MIDMTDKAEILEVLSLLVDVLRRSDPEFCRAHGVPECSDSDRDTALEAGEDVLEANFGEGEPSHPLSCKCRDCADDRGDREYHARLDG